MKKLKILIISIMALSACTGTDVGAPTEPRVPTIPPTGTAIPETETPPARPTPSPTQAEIISPYPTIEVDERDLALQQQGLLPEFESDVTEFEKATWYWIEVEVEFAPEIEFAHIEGFARINYTNQGAENLDEIVLMLWPNHPQYQAEMMVNHLMINDEFVEVELGEDDLYLRVPLTYDLEPGDTLQILTQFEVIVSGSIGEVGLKRFGVSYDILAAPTFYPLLPRLIDGEWQVNPGSVAGDTTNSDIGFYSVTITAPENYVLVASGIEADSQLSQNQTQTKTFVSGPMRDIAFVLGPFEKIERTVDDVNLNGWVLRGHREDGETMMDAAADQFSLFSNLLGPYPYPELDLVDIPGGFGGIEYPGLVFIGTLGEDDIIDPTVHEVAHQWFYGLIGNDQLIEPWLDEGASRFSQVLYYENFVSRSRGQSLVNYDRSLLYGHHDRSTPIGMPIDSYTSPADYRLFVYSKGALFFDQLRTILGEETFNEILKTYFNEYRYGFATSEDFQEITERVCSCDLDELFEIWVFKGGEIFGEGN